MCSKNYLNTAPTEKKLVLDMIPLTNHDLPTSKGMDQNIYHFYGPKHG